MSYNYKKAYKPAKGYTPICKIGECSLKKLEFGIIELDAGEKLTFNTYGIVGTAKRSNQWRFGTYWIWSDNCSNGTTVMYGNRGGGKRWFTDETISSKGN